MKSFTLSLALIVRFTATREWPITKSTEGWEQVLYQNTVYLQRVNAK